MPDEEAARLLVADGAETLLPQRLVQTCTFVPVKQVNRVPYRQGAAAPLAAYKIVKTRRIEVN